MKLVTIVGARPQFIKAAAVSNRLKKIPGIEELLVHTGQHFDGNMSKIFFDELEIDEPKYNLGIFGGLHGAQTGRMLEKIEETLVAENPDVVMVYGDTNSTLAGALAASKLHIPVVHIEAGLRSYNRHMPEEINRVLTDHVSDALFVPTEVGVTNLRREGILGEKFQLVGDVMYDAALHFGKKAETSSSILKRLGLHSKKYLLATIHRAENTDTPDLLYAILDALKEVAHDIPVVLPLHPRTRKIIENDGRFAELNSRNGIQIIDPVGYLDMVMLEKNARLIATDSGGVQKEAFFYRVPCVTLRNETEWIELVELGWNTLLPPSRGSAEIARMILAKLDSSGIDSKPYGDGNAAQKIALALWERYGAKSALEKV
jgi:UDP-GlcNAc3NAcA epimerase